MSTNIPAQPEAPDYAEANREGIYADIDTLPIRRQIDQAARLGQRVEYVDPKTGETKVADFTGAGDMELARQGASIAAQTNADLQRQQLALREELGLKNVEQTAKEIKAADPLAYDTRQKTTQQILDSLDAPASDIKASDAVTGAQARLDALADRAPTADARLGELYAQASAMPTKADDMGAVRTLQALQLGAVMDKGAAPTLQRMQGQAGRSAAGSQLGSIYDEATRLMDPTVTEESTSALNAGLQRALEDFNSGGKLDENTRRELLNEVRAGQAARGNYLGDAASVVEAQEIGSALEKRRAAQLSTLLDVQNRAFSQNSALRDEERTAAGQRINTLAGLEGQRQAQDAALRAEQAGYATATADQTARQRSELAALSQQLFGTGQSMRTEEQNAAMQRLGMLTGISGQQFGQDQSAYQSALGAAGQAMGAAQGTAAEERAARAENYGRDQQKLANASAIVLGQPITNQFGSLGSAQQGAVGFTPLATQGGMGLNANAGQNAANFAQQSFGTNANMWTTAANIAQQDNAGKMSMISGAAGATLGMI